MPNCTGFSRSMQGAVLSDDVPYHIYKLGYDRLMTIDFNQPQIASAIVGGVVAAVVSLAVAIINQLSVRSMHRQRIVADHALAERKIDADIALAERRFTFDRELAERKFSYDREFNDHKRRVDLAEEVLGGFLKMRDIIKEIRSPHSFGNEGEDRPKWEGETEHQANARRIYFVSASRLLKQSDFINGLMTKRYQMNAYFGRETEVPFDVVWEVLANIQSAVLMMTRSIDPQGRREGDAAIWRSWESIIWAGSEKPDPYAGKIEDAIGRMEAICRPVLSGQGA
jgi:hypothetical protein